MIYVANEICHTRFDSRKIQVPFLYGCTMLVALFALLSKIAT